jgi:hypothetical protein
VPKEERKHQEFNGVKVFSATMAQERDRLGERVTAWLRENAGYEIVDCRVTQSSDNAFHCLAMTIFYRDPAALPPRP